MAALLAWGSWAALLACALRVLLDYPICANDESAWIHIARQLNRGVDWPVSGPAFVDLLRQTAWYTAFSPAQVMPWLGVAGVFVVVCGLGWGYARLGLTRLLPLFATLALSSYFWAPLLEARPQQWGQLAVFLGSISVWRWLQQRGGLAFFVALPCVAFTHILSHAVLVFLCCFLVAADSITQRRWSRRHLLVVLSLATSLAVYGWPDGPYAAMLQDLAQAHLKHWPLGLADSVTVLSLAALLGLLLLWATQGFWRQAFQWPAAIAALLLRHRRSTAWALGCAAIAVLAMQAYLLPPEAWDPYEGSWLRFALFQSGNLMFAAFFLIGAGRWLMGLHPSRIDPVMTRFLVWALLGFALLGLLSVTVSWWLLHTNWFLRVLNYGIFFAALPAAIGVEQLSRHWPGLRRNALLAAGTAASLVCVVRPPLLLGC